MNSPKVTIITPSFNQGRFIEETILSVLDQDYINIEYIVIDGGSTDETVSILKKYDSRIDFWVSEPDKGQSDAINKGLIKASGDIIAWLNSDDQYFSLDVVSNIVNYFKENSEKAVCYGDNIYIDEFGEVLYLRKAPHFFSRNLLNIWNFIHQPTVFIKKKIIKENKINNDLNFIMDYEYWLRISNDNAFGYVNGIISASRWHSDCKTIGNTDKFFSELKTVRDNLGLAENNKYVSSALLFKLYYNLQRLFSFFYLYELLNKKKLKTIKINNFILLALRQIIGMKAYFNKKK